MKRILLLALCALLSLNAGARTLYVDAKRPNNNGNGLSKAKAKKTIQAAINVAKKGDTILVLPGTYAPIETNNKKIEIKSTKGAKKTKILSQKSSCLALADLSKSNKRPHGDWKISGNASSLSGFVLDGAKECCRAIYGGTVRSCIVRNCENLGGFIDTSKIYDCSVANNYMYSGSLFDACTVFRTKIAGNKRSSGHDAEPNFGKWLSKQSTFVNCLVSGNEFHERTGQQPAICASSLLNCTVADNTITHEDEGAPISGKSKFYNCILRNNYSQRRWREQETVDKYGEHEEWGYYDRNGTWVRDENEIDEGYEDENGDWVYYQYQSRTVDGPYTTKEYVTHTEPKKVHNVDTGNTYKNTDKTNRDPKLTSAYKLRKGSYCINSGKLTKSQKKLVGAKDLAGKKRIKGKAIDRGCYEF